MKKIHTEILTKEQKQLLPLIKLFSKSYYLAGGTAIALHIGHRKSIDFDLFTDEKVYPKRIREKIQKAGYKTDKTIHEEEGQAHYIINGVKVTFYNYPFKIKASVKIPDTIKIPDLLTLAAMKAYAISERGKWKDYVDLYFILKDHFTVKEILGKTNKIFGSVYNDRMFLEQLTYFDDISYAETVDYIKDSPSEETIKKFLIKTVTNYKL